MNHTEIPFYICHCKKLTERKEPLEKELDRVGIKNATWILDFDGDELPDGYEETILNTSLWGERMQMSMYPSPPRFRVLSRPISSLVMKHRESYRKFVETDSDYALVSEDDTIFNENFGDEFSEFMGSMPPQVDIVHMCAASGLFPNGITTDQHFYEHPLTRGTGLYLISKRAATIMSEGLDRFCGPIDFEINYFVEKYNLKSFWLHPLLAIQGSETVYGSSLKGVR